MAKSTLTLLFLLVFLPLGTACELPFGSGDPIPEDARVVISGDSWASLRLVTSNSFDQGRDETTGDLEIMLFEADTLAVGVPFDDSFPLGSGRRILVQVSNTDTVPTEVRLQVFLGAEAMYDRTAVLTDEELQFAWAYF